MSDLATQLLEGDPRALARAISLAERRDPASVALLDELGERTAGPAFTVGLTGAPGAGKSTLVDAMVHAARARGRTVGVLAVDPSSPVTGGALLGDRLRMDAHLSDPGVYVRSMSARGRLGGLAPAAGAAAWLLGAFGFDEVLLETVGTGQSEREVSAIVDTTVLVLTPGAGDDVQLEKAGILEMADVFAVNKADLPGADRLVRDLRTMLNLGPRRPWRPPIVTTVATRPDEAISALWDAIAEHREHLTSDESGRAARLQRLIDATAAAVGARASGRARALVEQHDDLQQELLRRRLPEVVAERLLNTNGTQVPRYSTQEP